MEFSPFEEMQKAVDIVGTSPHPANKIAATLFGVDQQGGAFSLSYTNYWPDSIAERVGTEVRIGSSSGTIHAETACILKAPATDGASLCVTDPFCPNCAKNIAEAGIRTIYIDHKGFDKDFAARRSGDFSNMSMQICEWAGINVYEIRRKEQKLVPIYEAPADFCPIDANPLTFEKFDGGDFEAVAKDAAAKESGAFAAALAEDGTGAQFYMACGAHPFAGCPPDHADAKQGKYSFIVEPVNRLLMNAARRGLKISDGKMFSAHVPTAREQVNLVGAGITQLCVGDVAAARDEAALAALALLSDKKILNIVG